MAAFRALASWYWASARAWAAFALLIAIQPDQVCPFLDFLTLGDHHLIQAVSQGNADIDDPALRFQPAQGFNLLGTRANLSLRVRRPGAEQEPSDQSPGCQDQEDHR